MLSLSSWKECHQQVNQSPRQALPYIHAIIIYEEGFYMEFMGGGAFSPNNKQTNKNYIMIIIKTNVEEINILQNSEPLHMVPQNTVE